MLARMIPTRPLGARALRLVSVRALHSGSPRSLLVALSARRQLPLQSTQIWSTQLRTTPQQVRFYGARLLDEPAKEVKYDEVAAQVKSPSPDIILVDVREPDEYAVGHIPGAINIPYRSSPGALGLDPAEFEDTFGFAKPDTDKNLVFYCQAGVRATGAEQLASTYGYTHRANYVGSMNDWLEHQQQGAPVTPPSSPSPPPKQ